MKKSLLAVLTLVLLFLLSSCLEQPNGEISSQDTAEFSEESLGRKERKEQERKARAEEALEESADEEAESPWKNYVEPQLEEGMGRVLPTLETPSGATALFVRYYKDWNMLGALKCISDYDDYAYYSEYSDYLSDEPQDLYDGLMALILKESQYSIISEEVLGNRAVVRLQCKAFSGEVLMDLYSEMLIEAGLFDYYEEYDQNVLKGLNFNIVPLVKFEVDAYLIKCDDGLWRLDIDAYENERVMNALTGDLMGIVDDYYYEYFWKSYYGDWYSDWNYGGGQQDNQSYSEWYRNWHRENFEQQDNKEAL